MIRAGMLARLVVVAVVLLSTGGYVQQVASQEKGAPVAFQAEVSKMLDILVNSLYTNRDIFLRELISNGSDALDKIRVLYLTSPKEPVNQDGIAPVMEIDISFNPEQHQLIIRDGGIGMTKDELAQHLGSLGTSGTKRFLERMQEAQRNATPVSGDATKAKSGGSDKNGLAAPGASNLIGQFGVGFYSVFLVADRVKVASKSDESPLQYVWESTGDGQYYVYEDPRGNTLGRGTEITIDVRSDAQEYLRPETIKRVLHQYSEFIHFPIYLEEDVSSTPEDEKENAEETTTSAKAESGSADGTAATEEKQQEEDVDVTPPPPSDVEVTWQKKRTLVNANRPIWTRPPSEIDDAEYAKFYKSLTDDYRDPLYYSHFHVEGEIELDSILFVPDRIDDDPIADDEHRARNIKLYVRRVFITDEFRDLLPHYLSFVKGIVDSNDLPLNVSREVLQENRILLVIKKKLVRKALLMFNDIAEQDDYLMQHPEITREDRMATAATTRTGTKLLTRPSYTRFWELFGKHIRRGIVEDTSNRGRLTKLLRYPSSYNESSLTSLQAYVSRMPPNQKAIYYLSGDSIELIKRAPVLEDALARNFEVLYMTDAIDEYVVAHITDFRGKKLVNLAREGVALEEDTAEQRVLNRKRQERYAPLLKRLRDLFGHEEVSKVVLTKRFTREAFLLSSGASQMTARLARLIRSQTMTWDDEPARAQRVLEINYRHPLVDELFKRFAVDATDPVAQDIAWVLYDTANIRAEFPISDVAAYAGRINRLLRSSVDIAPDEELLPQDDADYLRDDEEDKGEAAHGGEEGEEERGSERPQDEDEDERRNDDRDEEARQGTDGTTEGEEEGVHDDL